MRDHPKRFNGDLLQTLSNLLHTSSTQFRVRNMLFEATQTAVRPSLENRRMPTLDKRHSLPLSFPQKSGQAPKPLISIKINHLQVAEQFCPFAKIEKDRKARDAAIGAFDFSTRLTIFISIL